MRLISPSPQTSEYCLEKTCGSFCIYDYFPLFILYEQYISILDSNLVERKKLQLLICFFDDRYAGLSTCLQYLTRQTESFKHKAASTKI